MSRLEPVFLTDGQIAARVGVATSEWQAIAKVLTREGLPQPDLLFGNRRYWPAVKAWLDRRAGLSSHGHIVKDGEENWGTPLKAIRRSKPKAECK